MTKSFYKILVLFFISVLAAGCVDKFPTEELVKQGSGTGNIGGDTVYVQTGKPWEGFNNPQDIIIGHEPFIYVADTENDRIVMLNLDGEILGTRSVKRPVALAQDFQLNLVVCAEFDTVVGGITTTFGAVFKYDMVASGHQIENAPETMLLPRKNSASDFNNPSRRYTGATVFFNNSFYIARTGTNNATFVDPDNSILVFQKKQLSDGSKTDTLIGRVPLIEPLGSGVLSANNISSITNLNKISYDILVTLIGNTSLKVQWDQFTVTQEFTGYVNRLSPGEAAIMTPNKFDKPEGIIVDDAGNVFVADAGKDSIYKFNNFGDELQSFGGPSVFNQPHAVAFFDKTLYVADTGNNRILRFILSTDLR